MGLLNKLFGGKSCAYCGRPMKLLEGGMMIRTSQYRFSAKGCFQCRACGRLTCYGCSDNRLPCKCGAHAWIERTYT